MCSSPRVHGLAVAAVAVAMGDRARAMTGARRQSAGPSRRHRHRIRRAVLGRLDQADRHRSGGTAPRAGRIDHRGRGRRRRDPRSAVALRLVRPLLLPLLPDTASATAFALIEIIGQLSVWFALVQPAAAAAADRRASPHRRDAGMAARRSARSSPMRAWRSPSWPPRACSRRRWGRFTVWVPEHCSAAEATICLARTRLRNPAWRGPPLVPSQGARGT